jgi:hypothetical protein
VTYATAALGESLTASIGLPTADRGDAPARSQDIAECSVFDCRPLQADFRRTLALIVRDPGSFSLRSEFDLVSFLMAGPFFINIAASFLQFSRVLTPAFFQAFVFFLRI